PDTWEFKIVRMVQEGAHIEAGAEVVAFDPSELEKKLTDYESEVAGIVEELGTSRAERELGVLSEREDLEGAEARRRKAELKAAKPGALTARGALETSGIERDLARREVAYQKERERSRSQQAAAAAGLLEARLRRARARVEEIRGAIASM